MEVVKKEWVQGFRGFFRVCGVSYLGFRVEGFGSMSTMRKMSSSPARGDSGDHNCLFGGTRGRQWLPSAFASKNRCAFSAQGR